MPLRGYHGTRPENLPSILAEGLRARPPSTLICFTVLDEDMPAPREHVRDDDDPAYEMAKDWGGVSREGAVIEVDLAGLNPHIFEAEGTDGSVWEARVEGPIPASLLKVVFEPKGT